MTSVEESIMKALNVDFSSSEVYKWYAIITINLLKEYNEINYAKREIKFDLYKMNYKCNKAQSLRI